MSKNNQEDDFQEVGIIKAIEKKSYIYEVHLDQDISEPENYRELISALFNAGPDDRFHVYINSCGGYLSSCGAIVEGMKNTQATVCAILVGNTHSAASIITMYCDEVLVLDYASMMVHTAQYGTYGFVGNVKAHSDFEHKQSIRILNEAYSGFLTEEEMLKVQDGVEMWFDAEEIRQRINNRKNWIEAKLGIQGEETPEQKPRTRRSKKAE